MDAGRIEKNPIPETISAVVQGIAALAQPQRIYLYNRRLNHQGDTAGFKLCVVAKMDDKPMLERRVYLDIDSDVPFDVLLYTPEEWAELSVQKSSFACKILRTGIIVYG